MKPPKKGTIRLTVTLTPFPAKKGYTEIDPNNAQQNHLEPPTFKGYAKLLNLESYHRFQLSHLLKKQASLARYRKAQEELRKDLPVFGQMVTRQTKDLCEEINLDVQNAIKESESKIQDLQQQLNSGNLRHVVHALMSERGISKENFAILLNRREVQLDKLFTKGICSESLLNQIFLYFGIEGYPMDIYKTYTQGNG